MRIRRKEDDEEEKTFKSTYNLYLNKYKSN